MRWHKKHPRGGKAQYMGFDTSSAPIFQTEAEIREFHRTKYLSYHYKNKTNKDIVQSEDAYVKTSQECYQRDLIKWNNR
jgi:hypothetical protein